MEVEEDEDEGENKNEEEWELSCVWNENEIEKFGVNSDSKSFEKV
jgi:hypothetical protein